jgi:hypothetical protein
MGFGMKEEKEGKLEGPRYEGAQRKDGYRGTHRRFGGGGIAIMERHQI